MLEGVVFLPPYPTTKPTHPTRTSDFSRYLFFVEVLGQEGKEETVPKLLWYKDDQTSNLKEGYSPHSAGYLRQKIILVSR
jgi:hypothetical protein